MKCLSSALIALVHSVSSASIVSLNKVRISSLSDRVKSPDLANPRGNLMVNIKTFFRVGIRSQTYQPRVMWLDRNYAYCSRENIASKG